MHSTCVLVVCTGNICRSPAAERLLTRLSSEVAVTSAGTRAMVGSPIAPPIVALLEAAGAETRNFSARQLTEQLVRSADLVFAITRAHRAAVVELWPAAVRRTFTLLEFARLLPSIDPEALGEGSTAERLSAAMPLVAAERRQTAVVDDVADPYGRSEVDYAVAFEQIRAAVSVIGRIVLTDQLPKRDSTQ